MTRYLRLGYLIPRLVFAAVLFVALQTTADWLLRRAVIDGGQQAIGARVEIEDSSVSLLNASVSIAGLRVANPERPMENLVEAERLRLDFKTDSLLRRKAVAEHGKVSGLRFATPRATSGVLESDTDSNSAEAPSWSGGRLADRASKAADNWLGGLRDKLFLEAVDELASVRLADQLAQEWPNRYERLKQSSEEIRGEIESLRADAINARQNPLRSREVLETLPTRVSELKRRLDALHAEFDELPGLIEADKQRIALARRQDEALIRQRFSADQLDPGSLTSFLLGEQVTAPIRELIGWARWSRELLGSGEPEETNVRGRGVDIVFKGVQPRPDFLVRSLDLDGVANLGGRPVELTGAITDFTTSPKLHAEPMRLVMQTTGALPLKVTATVDRTGPTPLDEVLVTCQSLDLPQLDLGDQQSLSLSVAPAAARLAIRLRIEGQRLAGQMQLVQDDFRASASLPAAGQVGQAIASQVSARLSNTPKVSTQVLLGGTLDNPRLKLKSNLGSAVAQALNKSVQSIAAAETERLIAEANGRINQRVALLDNLTYSATQELASQLGGPQREIDALAADLLRGGSFPTWRIGDALPAGSLFK